MHNMRFSNQGTTILLSPLIFVRPCSAIFSPVRYSQFAAARFLVGSQLENYAVDKESKIVHHARVKEAKDFLHENEWENRINNFVEVSRIKSVDVANEGIAWVFFFILSLLFASYLCQTSSTFYFTWALRLLELYRRKPKSLWFHHKRHKIYFYNRTVDLVWWSFQPIPSFYNIFSKIKAGAAVKLLCAHLGEKKQIL